MNKNFSKNTVMQTLNKKDIIKRGIYAGETVAYVLKKGKAAIREVLKYYDLCPEIMAEYHFHLRPHEEGAMETVISNTIAVNDKDINIIEDCPCDEIILSEEMDIYDLLNASEMVDQEESCWESTRTDYRDRVLYDPEDDMADADYNKLMRWSHEHTRGAEMMGYVNY